MAGLQPIDVIGGFYADPDRAWSVQDTCNWDPVLAEQQGTRTPIKLGTPCGLTTSWTVGEGDPCRLLYVAEGAMFAIHGNTLRQFVAGSWVTRGAIPGAMRCTASHNGRESGMQVRFNNGQFGGGYVWDNGAQTFTKITDPGYPGSVSDGYIDHYLTGVSPDGRFWFISNLDDAMDYNTLDRQQGEASPDRMIAAQPMQFEVVAFSQTTTEFFANTGSAQGTFQNKRAVIDVGCAGRFTVQSIDNTLIWLGNDGIVYRINGYQKQRISTTAIEKAIAGLNWVDALSYTHVDRGRVYYFLHFPDGRTWRYDCASQLWSRRESLGMDRWRVSHIVKWNGDFYAGSLFDGKIWKLDWDSVTEDGEPFVSYRRTQVVANAGNPFRLEEVAAQVQVGAKPDNWPVGVDHELMFRYSKDGGYNWSNAKRRSMGLMGEYNTIVLYQNMGLFRKELVLEFSCSSPRKRDLHGATAKLSAA